MRSVATTLRTVYRLCGVSHVIPVVVWVSPRILQFSPTVQNQIGGLVTLNVMGVNGCVYVCVHADRLVSHSGRILSF